MDFDFVDPRTLPFVEPASRGELPHLYKDGAWYFVTFRLFDAVLRDTVALNHADDPAITRISDDIGTESTTLQRAIEEVAAIARSADPPITLGSCLLRRSEIAELVQESLRHFDGQRYHLAAWCVLPNHVHAVFSPIIRADPRSILHSWKSFTAHQVNRLLARQGTLWERESFDHMIRTVEHFDAFVRYVEENPVAAGLCGTADAWPWSSAQRSATFRSVYVNRGTSAGETPAPQ